MNPVRAQKQQDDDVQNEENRHVRLFSNTLAYLELSLGCNSLHALVLAFYSRGFRVLQIAPAREMRAD